MATIENKKTINFGNFSFESNDMEMINNAPTGALVVVEGTGIVFEGENGGVDTYSLTKANEFDSALHYGGAISVRNGGDLTIKGGTYKSPATCIYVTNGTCTIEGGFFVGQPDATQKTKSEAETEYYGLPYRIFTLNCSDGAYKNGTAKIIVKGGKFAGFDPAHNWAEGENTNFVAEGYKSVKLDETYTFTVKDVSRPECGQLITVPVWEVVSEN